MELIDSDQKKLQAFKYTVEEYMRLFDISEPAKQHQLTEMIGCESERKETKVKLILLRKYASKTDSVFLGKIFDIAEKVSRHSSNQLTELRSELEDIEKDPMKALLEDGERLSLRETIELELYGIHLHGDYDKICKLLITDSNLRYIATRKYVEVYENLLFKTYKFINEICTEKLASKDSKKGILLVSNNNNSKQDITGSPEWSHIFGRDVTDEEGISNLKSLPEEEQLIIAIANMFLSCLELDDVSPESIRPLIHPKVAQDWGNFSAARDYVKGLKKIGVSSCVRFNERHDMAYVYLLENVENTFVIEEYQIINGAIAINFVKEAKSNKWMIYSIGEKMEDYLIPFKPLKSVLKTIKRRFKQ